ncbi:MAG: amidohydrolase family protein [Pseudomonadota bacterium]
MIRGLIGTLFLGFACLVSGAAAAQPQRQMPPQMQQRQAPQQPATPIKPPVAWIDVHMHLIGGGRGGVDDFPGAVEAALREMDQFGMAMALILPPPQVDGQRSSYDYSSYAGALRRHPQRFAYLAGGGTLNATLHRHADLTKVTAKVKQEFAALAEKMIDDGAVGFGEMASLHISATEGHPYEFVPADHPLLLVLADVAAKRDVPIDLHMDAVGSEMPTPRRFAEQQANPPRLPATMGALERLLAHNPKAKIVWAHGGSDPIGGMTPGAIGRMMDTHPNLYVSIRVGPAQAPMQNKALVGRGTLDAAWAALLNRHPDRFVIGTDSFVPSPAIKGGGPGLTFAEKRIPTLQATVQFLSLLPPDVAPKIGRDNAVRIYKLNVK